MPHTSFYKYPEVRTDGYECQLMPLKSSNPCLVSFSPVFKLFFSATNRVCWPAFILFKLYVFALLTMTLLPFISWFTCMNYLFMNYHISLVVRKIGMQNVLFVTIYPRLLCV